MVVNHFAPGRFRARLTVRGLPLASRHDYEVGAAVGPEAALDIAVQYWCSDAWHGPIEFANFAEVFRYLDNGELQTAPSFVGY
jgi:hypothetical protein